MKSSKVVNLEQVETGMILAQDVLDANGTCLMTSGIALSASQISSLKRRSINSIAIEIEEGLSADELSAQREACIKQLDHCFRQVKDNADMQRLKNVLLAYRLDSMG